MTPQEFRARYEIDYKWRDAWLKLLNTREPNRLQSREDRIARRANLANNRIAKLMRDYDKAHDSETGSCAQKEG